MSIFQVLTKKPPVRKKPRNPNSSRTVRQTANGRQYIHKMSSRARSFRLTVNSSGEPVVTTPNRFNQNQLEAFVTAQEPWIKHHQQLALSKKNFLESATEIRIFDKLYQKKIQIDPYRPSQVSLGANQTLQITVPEPGDQTTKKVLERFLTQTAESYIISRVQILAKRMNLDYTKVKFGQHKSQWGSCHRNGTLTFNWRLVHAPTKVIDYVLIHELAHRVHHDHSPSFWRLVEQFDSEYTQHRNWLKRHGVSEG